MRPRVTLIIRTYNRAGLVWRAIDSVLDQGYPNLGVIVVDDGSTDDTQQILQRYSQDRRVSIITHERNRGVTAAGNTGLARLGEHTAYFGLVDSDDTLEPGALETLVGVFEETGDRYSLVLGWCRNVDTGASTGQMSHLAGGEGLVSYEDALAGHFAGEFWHLARRDLLGTMRFEERARGGEGSVWWRMLRARPGWLVPIVVRNYSTSGSDRVSVPRYTPDAARGMMWIQRAMLDAVGRDLRLRFPGLYGASLAEMAKWAALAGEGCYARAAARQALRCAPSPRAGVMLLVALTPASLLRLAIDGRAKMRHLLAGGRG